MFRFAQLPHPLLTDLGADDAIDVLLDFIHSPLGDMIKSPTLKQYLDWLNAATDARDNFLAGKLTEEETPAIIIVP